MPGCCAFGCTNRHEKGFKLYRFPSDVNRRTIWENKINRLGWKPNSSSKLCEITKTRVMQWKGKGLQILFIMALLFIPIQSQWIPWPFWPWTRMDSLEQDMKNLIARVDNLKTAETANQNTIQNLIARVDNLKTAETTNQNTIQILTARVDNLKTAETTNNKTIQNLIARVDDLKTAETTNQNTIQNLIARVDNLKTAETTNQNTIQILTARVDNLMTAETTNNKTIQDLTTRVGKLDAMSDKRKVWFAAAGGHTKTSDDKVIFTGVCTNMGNAYDANTGIFTAPYKGAYFFTVNYRSQGQKIYLDVYKEKKNGNREWLMQLYDDTYIKDKEYMASSSRMVDLEVKDKVYVYAGSDHELTCCANMFSGFLVHPM
ncbi:uncharacterized protein LOC129189101 isoform X2 [Dunckerocampus dactyliophorus]|uniref:uncharacterized protein LOC129189101 isoform X2 n=1 Tax=Dunckerocampus dactyliophorus TaxID=161453 RepID=UPI002404EA99|nr:uncharacterized protein LOC129189101 isoform X2 [Dunckerocampus dactyliophorus]